MELKNYQEKVMDDLSSYLSFLNKDNNLIAAWKDYWNDKDIRVGLNGVPYYNNSIKNVPHVCMKVPTGGGKTFMACASLKKIMDEMPQDKPRVVVWLVPSDSILLQTVRNLSNPNHPYRERINRDFGNRVEVYTKEQLLNGQNFSPDTVREVLSVCVLGYASLRITKLKADDRKVYQENGNLKRFADYFRNRELILTDTPETALMQILAQMSPVVVVDESHNAQSDLSIEMLNRLNPSFILDLTATPKDNSNIISYVDARELKKENMVKLPVVVFNRSSRPSVIQDAIQLRGSLEQLTVNEATPEGRAIRPIVLFQAQPKANEDSTTFEVIRNKLVEMGIPEDQIGIKTSKVDTISSLDLMSPDCKIRYIITVNALKEGWDCPYAYILASLANKTSKVDVEQILGRILRQPKAIKYSSPHLNTSYVLTCSADFSATLDNIVSGLNRAGFSKKDYRVSDVKQDSGHPDSQPELPKPEQDEEDRFDDVIPSAISVGTASGTTESVTAMLRSASDQAQEYESELSDSSNDIFTSGEIGDMLNQITVQKQFQEEVQSLKLPQFILQTRNGIFDSYENLLSPENLSDGFSLKDADTKINFQLAADEIFSVDLAENGEAIPKTRKTDSQVSEELRKYLATRPSDKKVQDCTDWICRELNRNNSLESAEIRAYVDRIISGMSDSDIEAMETSLVSYMYKIRQKIEGLEEKYREVKFNEWIETGRICCKPFYSLPNVITPQESIDRIDKSLYTAESASMNKFENKVITEITSLPNISWWHRNIERKGYFINGFITHYPDFIVKTASGKILLIETKGDYLDGSDSRQKVRLGRAWQKTAGNEYRYFMVFESNDLHEDGAYTLDQFIPILKQM